MSRRVKQVAVGLLVLVLGYFVVPPLAYRLSATTVTCTVTEKDDKPKPGQESGSTYMVWCKHADDDHVESLEVTDTAVFLRWDSSDRWGQLERGQTYEMYVAGWRLTWFSTYRNVISAEPVE